MFGVLQRAQVDRELSNAVFLLLQYCPCCNNSEILNTKDMAKKRKYVAELLIGLTLDKFSLVNG